jgi:hypothetical protein
MNHKEEEQSLKRDERLEAENCTLCASGEGVVYFRYWREGRVREGMRMGWGLYDCLCTLSKWQRKEAIAIGEKLAREHVGVVITGGEEWYTVWVRLGDEGR